MKRIIMTGGGTAGHVTPNLALIPKLEQQGYTIHYIGRRSGIEKDLVKKTGVPYSSISAGKLRRYFDFQNLTDMMRILKGLLDSLVLLRKIRPQVVFSKGGFVSCPLVWAAWINRIPVIVHESDITPGLANKLSIPFARHICFSFPETINKLPVGKSIHTGIPVREMLSEGKEDQGKTFCGFDNAKSTILVMGGSQGSEAINRAIRETLDKLRKTFQVCHICGKGHANADYENRTGYRQFEYVDRELPHLLAMADIVVSRAGATTLFELLELKKPNLLIPLSLKASRGDQILNAQSFEKQGFSRVLPEEELTSETLFDGISKAHSNRDSMIEAMNATGIINGIDEVLKVIESY